MTVPESPTEPVVMSDDSSTHSGDNKSSEESDNVKSRHSGSGKS
jgi:hypothetical protein